MAVLHGTVDLDDSSYLLANANDRTFMRVHPVHFTSRIPTDPTARLNALGTAIRQIDDDHHSMMDENEMAPALYVARNVPWGNLARVLWEISFTRHHIVRIALRTREQRRGLTVQIGTRAISPNATRSADCLAPVVRFGPDGAHVAARFDSRPNSFLERELLREDGSLPAVPNVGGGHDLDRLVGLLTELVASGLFCLDRDAFVVLPDETRWGDVASAAEIVGRVFNTTPLIIRSTTEVETRTNAAATPVRRADLSELLAQRVVREGPRMSVLQPVVNGSGVDPSNVRNVVRENALPIAR